MRYLELVAWMVFVSVSALAQASVQPIKSDTPAVNLAKKSIEALTRGMLVSDVTLDANVISILGSDYETGNGTLQAKGVNQSRLNFKLTYGTRSDVRGTGSGGAIGAWTKDEKPSSFYSNANCWTDAAWFFPAMSSLTQTANPAFTFRYLGQELHGGVNTEHIRVFQTPLGSAPLIRHLSTIDFYLDPTTSLPLATAFAVHPDHDASTDLPVEIRFAQYRVVSGVAVPFHIQRMINGGVILDLTVTKVTFNAGLLDAAFTLQ